MPRRPRETVEIPVGGCKYGNGLYALVDKKIAKKVKKHKWHMTGIRCGSGRYARTTISKGNVMSLHEFVMRHQMKLVILEGGVIDHIDRDPLNNTSANLRIVTNKENSNNRKVRSDNMCGYKGVSKDKGKWRARAGTNGKISLGRFNSAKEAAIAYNTHLQSRTDIRECVKVYNKID